MAVAGHVAFERQAELGRRAEALLLAEELLGDVELERVNPMAAVRKASRLARLTGDTEATSWLSFESGGYPDPLTLAGRAAAERSHRVVLKDGEKKMRLGTLATWAAEIASLQSDLGANGVATISGEWALAVDGDRARRHAAMRSQIVDRTAWVEDVLGEVHSYVATTYQQLRFGSAVESAFEVVRGEVDSRIGGLVPELLPMIAAAFENASSENREHWQSAAATCRRLLMTAADRLRPPGPDVQGRKMGQGNYVNRLVDWILGQAESETARKMIAADLEYLGPRLDAADGAGQKGAHVGLSQVSRVDASRFITGTYLVLGDILRLRTAGEGQGSPLE